MTLSLRDYQRNAVTAINAALFCGEKPLLVCPTGGGKTEIFLFLATHTDARVIIVVHRNELVHQTSKRLGDIPHGIIQSGVAPNPYARIQVASIGTLVNRLHLYKPDLLIFDEAHHAVSRSWQRVITAYPDTAIVGVTATPCRLDGSGLRDAGFTELLLGPSVADLTAQGYLAPVKIYVPLGQQMDTSDLKMQCGDYSKKSLKAAAEKHRRTGCAIEHYRRFAHKVPAIMFCVSVEDAEDHAYRFRAAGYRAESIDGKMSPMERHNKITALGNDGLDLLMSCDLISEGVDVPVVGCGIFSRPTQSLGLYLQQMGRILRTYPGKDRAIAIDHVGMTFEHGLPDAPRDWTLDGQKRGKRETGDVAVRICLECFRAHAPAAECPHCGFVYPAQSREIEQVAGELVLLDAQWAAAKAVLPGRMEEARARTLEDFQRIAEERGYKPGWAFHRWQARQRKTA